MIHLSVPRIPKRWSIPKTCWGLSLENLHPRLAMHHSVCVTYQFRHLWLDVSAVLPSALATHVPDKIFSPAVDSGS